MWMEILVLPSKSILGLTLDFSLEVARIEVPSRAAARMVFTKPDRFPESVDSRRPGSS